MGDSRGWSEMGLGTHSYEDGAQEWGGHSVVKNGLIWSHADSFHS